MFYIIAALKLKDGNLGISFIGFNNNIVDRSLLGINIYGKLNILNIQIMFLNIDIR